MGGFWDRHPRAERWNQTLGGIVLGTVAAALFTQLVLHGLFGASDAAAAAVYALLVARVVWAEARAFRRAVRE
jgi:predicted lipid-binding transport protein (Tim44 family)